VILKITIIGDGGWGTTLALLLNNNRYSVTIWSKFPDYADFLSKKRVNAKFLPGVKIPRGISITGDLRKAVSGAEIIILAVPSQYMRSVLKEIRKIGLYKGASFLSASKGIERKTLMRASEIIADVLGNVKIGVLSGPTISHEVSRGMFTAVVVASKDAAFAKKAQRIFNSRNFRVYISKDVVGVESGAALKNVIAIAAGILDGMKLGVNAKAGLVARGLAEISRLGVAMGAECRTFYGISGLGDLVTTCMSGYGRNRWFGEEIGKGRRPKDILKKTEMAVEGMITAESAYRLLKKYKVEMPITEQVYWVLYKGKSPKKAIADLMARPVKAE